MGAHKKPVADRLISIVAKHGCACTMRQIARSHLTGSDLERAKLETEGLVVFEEMRWKGSRKRSRAARLTVRGIWAAILLCPDFNPTRALQTLAATEIRAVLDRLEAEGNPLAVEIARDRTDAREYRRQLAAGEISRQRKAEREDKAVEGILKWLAKPHKRLSDRKRAEFERFLARHGRTLKPRNEVRTGSPLGESKPTLAPRSDFVPTLQRPREEDRPSPSTAAPASRQTDRCKAHSYCLLCNMNCEACACPQHRCAGNNVAARFPLAVPAEIRPPQAETDDSENRRKIVKAGYGSAIRGPNHVLYDNREVSFAAFVQKMGL